MKTLDPPGNRTYVERTLDVQKFYVTSIYVLIPVTIYKYFRNMGDTRQFPKLVRF